MKLLQYIFISLITVDNNKRNYVCSYILFKRIGAISIVTYIID